MDIGFKKNFFSGVPPAAVAAGESLLDICVYMSIRPNNAGSIVYEKGAGGLQKIWNYGAVYRWSDVARKVLSRQVNEQVRNDKWLVCGIGKNAAGQHFYFVHPFAQHFQSQVVVPNVWMMEAMAPTSDKVQWAQLTVADDEIPALAALAAQMPKISGAKNEAVPQLMQEVAEIVSRHMASLQPVASIFSNQKPVITKGKLLNGNQAGAVLFGYGNYARTIAVPYMQPNVVVQKVHEADPALLINCSLPSSTNLLPDAGDEKFAAWLIAGYHHTHAGLAIQAMQHGVIPVIEKPIATTHQQLLQLEAVAVETKQPFFQCFQKRYQIFNEYANADFNITSGSPIHYKAVVYEIPLHRQHWYNWPVSGSRIISNGCHWIDQFMFLNNYAACVHAEVKALNKDELLLVLQLENGATGVITLSDIGANRIGMREYVELSVPGKRISIIDSMWYKSESDHKIIRTAKTDKLHYLRRMYKHIAQSVVNKSAGDSLESLRSSFVAIALNEQFGLR